MKMLLKVTLLSGLGMMLAGCGEISYKRGAGPSELQAAQAECKGASTRDGYEKCMDQRGWTVQQMEDLDPVSDKDLDPVAQIAYSPDHRSPEATATATETGESSVSAKESVQESAKPAPNLTDIYNISSWWKMGGSPALLKQDINACVTELGELHRPPSDQRQATRGLLLCLKKQGWHGLQEYKRR